MLLSEACWWMKTVRQRAWPSLTAKRGKRWKSRARSSFSRHRASRRRISCSIRVHANGLPESRTPVANWAAIYATIFTAIRVPATCHSLSGNRPRPIILQTPPLPGCRAGKTSQIPTRKSSFAGTRYTLAGAVIVFLGITAALRASVANSKKYQALLPFAHWIVHPGSLAPKCYQLRRYRSRGARYVRYSRPAFPLPVGRERTSHVGTLQANDGRSVQGRRRGTVGCRYRAQPSGTSLHETGVCRFGKDAKSSVTNKWAQTHDVSNLYICDASIFPSQTDKTTTMPIIAFTMRTCDYILENFSSGLHTRA